MRTTILSVEGAVVTNRAQVIDLVRKGKLDRRRASIMLGCSTSTIGRWVKKDVEAGVPLLPASSRNRKTTGERRASQRAEDAQRLVDAKLALRAREMEAESARIAAEAEERRQAFLRLPKKEQERILKEEKEREDRRAAIARAARNGSSHNPYGSYSGGDDGGMRDRLRSLAMFRSIGYHL